MKQVFFVLAAMAMIIACNDSAKVAGANDQNDAAKRNMENIKAIYHALETGDTSKIGNLMTDGFVDHNVYPDNRNITGRDSAVWFISQFHTFFESVKFAFVNDATSADGTYHYTWAKMTAKKVKANPLGIPEGIDFEDNVVDVVKLKDGKATEHWGFLSWGDINEIMMMMHSSTPSGNQAKDSAGKK